MVHLVSIALGGALGALARYAITALSHVITGFSGLGTLVANLTGSFLIGVFWVLLHHIQVSPHLKFFLITGLLGRLPHSQPITWKSFSSYLPERYGWGWGICC